jgi:hypothetical protein
MTSNIRSKLRRAHQLICSNYGREYGWYAEYQGRVIGELTDPRWEDMFWHSYAAAPADREAEPVFFDDDLWNRCQFRFRNKVLNEYAENAFCGGTAPFICNGRILMRCLYLLPKSLLEVAAMRVIGWSSRIHARSCKPAS